jgi:phenylacetate-CoA ligase
MTGFSELRPALQREIMLGMPAQVARLSWGQDKIRAHQQDGLRRLLAHAKTHSPFHRARLTHVDAERFDLAQLRDLPVMTKHEMMLAFDELLTDRRISRAMAEANLAATRDEPVPLLDSVFVMATGGSSGERGVFVFDREALVQYLSALMRWRARQASPGASVRGAFVAAACPVHATAFSVALSEGGAFPLQFTPVPATLPIEEIVARLNALQPGALFGYPSMLYRLAVEAAAKRLRIEPRAISCTSETLADEQRHAISSAFGAPIVDTFGSTEGLIGQSAPNDNVLVFNSDQCIIELVDEQNRPVEPGTPSAKVLLTNLFNLTQPLIRYELNDRFVQQDFAADHGYLRATVEGRNDEMLRYGKIDIHPLAVRSVMVKTPSVLDYQVTQTPSGIDVAVVADTTLDMAALQHQLAGALRTAGLADPQVNLRRTHTLERNAQSGKLKRFVPLRAA